MTRNIYCENLAKVHSDINCMGYFEVSHATLRTRDLLETHCDMAAYIFGEEDPDVIEGRALVELLDGSETDDQEERAAFILGTIMDLFNDPDICPLNHYYGASMGDGSAFGWWESPEYWDEMGPAE